MVKITVKEALDALGIKHGTHFILEKNSEGTEEIRLISTNGRLRTVHTNFVSENAMYNYIAGRLRG